MGKNISIHIYLKKKVERRKIMGKERGYEKRFQDKKHANNYTIYMLLIVYGAILQKKLNQVVPPDLQVIDSPL